MPTGRKAQLLAALVLPHLLSACTSISPDSLKTPKQMACFDMPSGMEAHEKRGLLNIPWIYTLMPGPYLSEREDSEGVYYRAPPGGIRIVRDKDEDGSSAMADRTKPRYVDGGIWIPRTTDLLPHLYFFVGSDSDQASPLAPEATCDNAVLLPPSRPGGSNTVEFMLGGAAGGAVGGLTARASTGGGAMSYGQAAGIGAVGGAIAGLIVSKLGELEYGRLENRPALRDPSFSVRLREVSSTATPIASKRTIPASPQ